MLLGIFLLNRRGKKFIFRIVIDHGPGHDFVIRISSGLVQSGVNKCGYLINI